MNQIGLHRWAVWWWPPLITFLSDKHTRNFWQKKNMDSPLFVKPSIGRNCCMTHISKLWLRGPTWEERNFLEKTRSSYKVEYDFRTWDINLKNESIIIINELTWKHCSKRRNWIYKICNFSFSLYFIKRKCLFTMLTRDFFLKSFQSRRL